MRAHVHLDPASTSAPMVDRMAARMVIAHSVEHGWRLEHLDVRSAFLHEEYRYGKPVYVREMPRADGSYKHGGTIGLLRLNLYGNPSGTFYYIEGLMAFLRKMHAQLNEAESCLVRLQMQAGTVIAAVAIDDFIVAAENTKAMDQFYAAMKERYDIKRLGRPGRYLGWHCHYTADGRVALSQRLLIDKTLKGAGMLNCNGKRTPFPADTPYHAPDNDDDHLPDTVDLYRKLVGELRYIADSTRPDITFVTGRLGAAMDNPTVRHWNIMKATLRYLRHTRNYGLHFRKHTATKGLQATSATKPLTACADADWANDRIDRRSVKGGYFAWHGRPIGWISKK